MAVTSINLTIERGTDFETEFSLKDVDGLPFNLTNYRVFSKIRKHRNSETAISFNVGILSRVDGKILLKLPRWLSINLPFGRCVYDIVVVDFNFNKTVVLEGDIIVEGLVSQNCNFVLPTSAQRLCIAVIDESDTQTISALETKWTQFRNTYPNRPFYLLMPTNAGFGNIVTNQQYDTLRCPDNFLNETTVNLPPLI
jgi:hypothetical protein